MRILAFLGLLLAFSSANAQTPRPDFAQMAVELQRGGHVIVVRHGATHENARRAAALRELIETPPAPGTTLIVVTHKPNILDALGKDWFEVREGEASIFRPGQGEAMLVARVQIDEWPVLAAAALKR